MSRRPVVCTSAAMSQAERPLPSPPRHGGCFSDSRHPPQRIPEPFSGLVRHRGRMNPGSIRHAVFAVSRARDLGRDGAAIGSRILDDGDEAPTRSRVQVASVALRLSMPPGGGEDARWRGPGDEDDRRVGQAPQPTNAVVSERSSASSRVCRAPSSTTYRGSTGSPARGVAIGSRRSRRCGSSDVSGVSRDVAFAQARRGRRPWTAAARRRICGKGEPSPIADIPQSGVSPIRAAPTVPSPPNRDGKVGRRSTDHRGPRDRGRRGRALPPSPKRP